MTQSAEPQVERGRVSFGPWSGAALLLAVLLALAVGAIWLWLTASLVLAGAPRLEVGKTDLDLGYRKYSTQVRAEFVLANAGDGTLELKVPERAQALKGC